MVTISKQKWIDKAFKHFAEYGPEGLNIQKIAKDLKIPRTTFYHYFADKEDLLVGILESYIDRFSVFEIDCKANCKVYIPDFHRILARYEEELKFSRQLFLNRSNPVLNIFFLKGLRQSNKTIIPLFVKYYQFNIPYSIAEDLYNGLVESWFSRINPDELTQEAMQKITEEIMEVILKFYNSKKYFQFNRKDSTS